MSRRNYLFERSVIPHSLNLESKSGHASDHQTTFKLDVLFMRLYEIFTFNFSIRRVHETIISLLLGQWTCTTWFDSLRIQGI